MVLAARAGDVDGDWADRWDGWNIILAGADGRPDPLGSHVLAVRGGERVLLAVADFDARVDESRPGAAAPRPVLDLPGHGTVGYRVGPVAASRAAGRIDGPVAAQARVLAESVAAVVDIVTDRRDDLLAAGAADPAAGWKAGVPVRGVGAVDGPRGLLVHRYDGDGTGRLASCRILTPTAQNEPWLAAMLAEAVCSGGSGAGIVGARASGAGADEPGTGVDESRNVGSGASPDGQAASRAHPAMEAAVRAADPCLPISSAPAGSMRLSVVDEPPSSAPAER